MKKTTLVFVQLLMYLMLSVTASANELDSLKGDKLYQAIIAKYQPDNLITLSSNPDVETASQWSNQYLALIKTSRIEDARYISEAVSAGRLTPSHVALFDQQINNDWFNQAIAQVQQLYIQVETQVARASGIAPVISQLDESTAQAMLNMEGSPFANAGETLDTAVSAVNIASVLDELTGVDNKAGREQQLAEFIAARDKFSQLTGYPQKSPVSGQTAATKEQQQPPATADSPASLNTTAQYPITRKRNNPKSLHIYVNGSKYSEITRKGEVWFGGTSGGWVEDDGDIYVKSNFKGGFEDDGQVWSSARSLGSIEKNGDVWYRGSKVATFKPDGKFIISGGDYGHLEGKGDWR
ncbi:hypothetical protein [Alteromonas lipolytica]|uniref:Uncharacterized protein n=1 Tax=Alteromonas lipolytica TaxID=1856405 RepID=A0A1E8FG59_9ALTE|nr:hypothetical protein [Alteromonas lipolytica]OFI34726.1 hypothetical protein BFC17_14190 [Alteromonas lipolytica]GGF53520.1 hypothetical protein GCM10011338_02050 [Alteromonas lipolytica]